MIPGILPPPHYHVFLFTGSFPSAYKIATISEFKKMLLIQILLPTIVPFFDFLFSLKNYLYGLFPVPPISSSFKATWSDLQAQPACHFIPSPPHPPLLGLQQPLKRFLAASSQGAPFTWLPGHLLFWFFLFSLLCPFFSQASWSWSAKVLLLVFALYPLSLS